MDPAELATLIKPWSDRISELEAERDRLRAALEEIMIIEWPRGDWYGIARRALESK